MKHLILISILILTSACGKKQASEKEVMEALDGRPTMLVVGDSISIGYTPFLKIGIPNLQVIHNTGNAGDSGIGVRNILKWVSHSPRWELCTINHGIWDISIKEGASSVTTSLSQYVKNLEFEISVLRTRCERIIFILTTEIPVNVGQGRTNQNAIIYNEAAVELMDSLDIQTCDLYTISVNINHLHDNAEDQNNVHFNDEGSELLADQIINCIGEV